MLTHFFGNYLLEKELLTSDQLLEAFRHKNNNNRKLGNLAVAADYMTIEEVDDVYAMQAQMDGKFAEIAVHMGYLTEMQAEELLKAQSLGYLMLGNSIIELGYCTGEEMSQAIADYEFEYQLNFTSLLNSDKEKVERMVQAYYHFSDDEVLNPPWKYATLLLKNIIRFIGDDFRLAGKLEELPPLPNMYEVSQSMESSAFDTNTSIIGFKDFLLKFASRYACDTLEEFNEYADASLQDFLNLQNGLFSVNISNDHGVELNLGVTHIKPYDPTTKKGNYLLPIEFSFGTIYFCFS